MKVKTTLIIITVTITMLFGIAFIFIPGTSDTVDKVLFGDARDLSKC